MKRLSIVLCSTFVIAAAASALEVSVLAQGTSAIGSWTLNVAKSTFTEGTAPKSASLKNEAMGRAATTTVDAVAADGSAQHWTYTGAYDGVDVPVTGENQFGDTASRKRVNGTTTETTFKRAGKVTFVNRVVVSADAKTLTVTSKGADAEGRVQSQVAVFDKQ